MKEIVLYLTAKKAENSPVITGRVKFNGKNTMRYSCKINRGTVTNFTLLNKRKLNINEHMPSRIFEGIKKLIPLALCKSNTNAELVDLSQYKRGTITWKMYFEANRKLRGESSVVKISHEEFEPLFKEKQKLLPQSNQKYLAAAGS
jgi:hypothetical protein